MDHRDDAGSWAAPGAPEPAQAPAASSRPIGAPPVPTMPTQASWQPGFMPLRPLTFGDFLGHPFRAMRYNRGVIVGGPLAFTLVATLATTASMWLLFTDPSLALLDPMATSTTISSTTVAVTVLAVVAALLADVFSSAIVAPGVARGVLGERITLGEAWRAVRPRIGALLLLYVIATSALLLAFVPGVAVLIGGAASDSIGTTLLGLLLMLVLGIPAGVAVSTIGGIARPTLVLERRSAVSAIRRSLTLIRGRFWWSILIVFVATVIIGLVSSVIQQVGSLGAVLVAAAFPDNLLVLAIAFFTVTALSLVVSYVLTYAYLGAVFTLLHIDLRMRHEGFDLTLAEAAEARRAA